MHEKYPVRQNITGKTLNIANDSKYYQEMTFVLKINNLLAVIIFFVIISIRFN